jgi:hypothetical protein
VIVFETIGNTTVPCFNNDPMLVAAPLIRAASISVSGRCPERLPPSALDRRRRSRVEEYI